MEPGQSAKARIATIHYIDRQFRYDAMLNREANEKA